MKCIGIQHLEAVSRIAAASRSTGKTPLRNIYISFVPDEEIGGDDGMKKLVGSQAFADLNIGFALDEGLANPGPSYVAYYGERHSFWLIAEAKGPTGHGSQLFPDSAINRLFHFLQYLVTWRDEELARLQESNGKLKLGDVTTININMFKSGAFTNEDNSTYQVNIIPELAIAAVDIRLEPSVSLVEFKENLLKWAKRYDVTLSSKQFEIDKSPITSVNPEKNPWWNSIQETCDEMGIELEKTIFPAATDSRYIRALNIPAIGISPMNNTPVLLHDHNEYLNENVFLKGIDFFECLVNKLAALPTNSKDQVQVN